VISNISKPLLYGGIDTNRRTHTNNTTTTTTTTTTATTTHRHHHVWAFLYLEATRHSVTKSYVLRGPNKLFRGSYKRAYISGSVEFGENSFERRKLDKKGISHLKGLELEVKIT
jgi:hypothetical protein